MKSLVKTRLVLLLVVLPVAGLVMAAKFSHEAHSDRIERGKYLVRYGGCNDCHTPMRMTEKGPSPDLSRLLSGHPETVKLPPPPKRHKTPWFAATAGMTAWAGPWGISYASNLTPDQNTGLGIWTEDMFVKAMRTGKHLGLDNGRPILPPMPWPSYARMTDADLHALWTYLRSVPAIRNDAPQSIPAPPPPGAPAH